ncbi:MAG: T9SS type A sorting domain-containing protein [Bacteroidales bacterium]|nr:T9SS type A sorting domain-containing protein [Bacteroidales bacterium]
MASLSSPSIPAVLQIQLVKPYTSEWKDLQQFDYSPKPISYDEINSFVEENFHLESIIDDDIHQFALRVNIAGICSNTLNMPPYYLQVSFPKSNITLTDNTLQITNNNQLKVSVKDDFYNKHYDPDNELAPEREFQVNDGRCTIIIDYPQKKSCSVVYYVNVMRLTNNQITTCSDNKADFWYAGQESRDEAIVLHYFDIGPCPTPSFPSSISAKKVNGTSSDNLRVFSQTDEGTQGQKEQPCSSYLYYLNGCTRGKDNQFTITYNDQLYIPQTLSYTLESSFDPISIGEGNDNITIDDPKCKDQVGILHIKGIQGGIGCGYYYTREDSNGKPVVKDGIITDNQADIPVKKGDKITIYDKKNSEDKQYPFTEQRKFTYTINNIGEATPPDFEYSVNRPLCNGYTGSLSVDFKTEMHLSYEWTIQNSKGDKTYPLAGEESGKSASNIMLIEGLEPLDEDDTYKSKFTLKKVDDEVCWDIVLPAFTLTQPKKIEFEAEPVPLTCEGSNNGEISIPENSVKNTQGNYTAYYYPVKENGEGDPENESSSIYDLQGNPKQLGEGKYKVYIKDGKECVSAHKNVTIEHQTPKMHLETTAASCDLVANGKAKFSKIEGIRFEPEKIWWHESNENGEEFDLIEDASNLLEYESLGKNWYKVIFQDHVSCEFSSLFEIKSNSYDFSFTTTNASCADVPNGSATIEVEPSDKEGIFEPYEYILERIEPTSDDTKNPITIPSTARKITVDNLHYGTYKLTVNHDDKCKYENTVNIDTNHYVWDIKSFDLSCLAAANGNISASINKKSENDNGAFDINSFTWKLNGEKIEGGDNPTKNEDKTYPEFKLQAHTPGIYTLSIAHDKVGDKQCLHENSVEIKVNEYDWEKDSLYLSCENVKNGYISAVIKRKDDYNGNFDINSFSWTLNGNPYEKVSQPVKKNGSYSFELKDLAPGMYRLSLTHDDICTESTAVKIDVNDYYHNVTTTNAPCAEIPSATATAVTKILSGTPESFKPIYTWTAKNSDPEPTGSINTISNRFSGIYDVKIEWANKGCSKIINFNIDHDTLKPSVLTTNAECSDKESIGGKAVLNISTPDIRSYTYFWDSKEDNNNTKENLPAGSHNVSAIDNNGCHIDVPFDILNGNFSADVKTENALCRQDATGKVTFDIKGGRGLYSINWNGNSNLSQKNISSGTFTQDNIPVGIYQVDIKDETNCVVSHKVTISSGNLKVSHKESDASCASIGNAQAEITVTGAKLPVTYKWSDNVETSEPIRSNLPKGNYVVTVVDNNDCSMPVDINIYSKKLSAENSIDSATCGIDTDGAADIRLYSATAPFTFKWSDGKTTTTGRRDGMAKGEYTVHITDANGCEVSTDVFVPHKGYLQNDVPGSITLCTNGEITVDANEFIGYQWIYNGRYIDDNRFLTIKSPGTYLIKANGYDDCYAVDTIAVAMSPKSFSPYFRMSSVSYVNDTLVVMEMSQTNPDKYSWKYDTLAFDCDNTSGSERELRLIPKLSGLYSITLSAENEECVSDISKPVEIFATTRPDDDLSPLYVDNSIVKEFTISPNPTKGPITVEVNLSQIADVRLTIYDLNFGKIRKQVTLHNSDNYKLDINDVLYTGAYVVILQAGNETKQIKYIVGR